MSTDANVAVFVVGTDRPGIVAGVTRVLYDLGCNLLDVASTILRGHFAMMLMVEAPAGTDAAGIQSALEKIASGLGISVTTQEVHDPHKKAPAPSHMVSVYGSDKPGIVFRVAEQLAEVGANITDFSSRVIGSDEEPVYALLMEVDLPPGAQEKLELLAGELQVEVSVSPLEPDLL